MPPVLKISSTSTIFNVNYLVSVITHIMRIHMQSDVLICKDRAIVKPKIMTTLRVVAYLTLN